MEPEIIEAEGYLAPLKKVTPLSKYLAMILFIITPFLGGWIGYQYAPEKVVEVERVVVKEVEVEKVVEVSQEITETALASETPDGYSAQNIDRMIESGDITVYQGDRVIVAVANMTFGMADSQRVVVNVKSDRDVFESVLAALESMDKEADYVDRERIEVTYTKGVYSGDDIVILQ